MTNIKIYTPYEAKALNARKQHSTVITFTFKFYCKMAKVQQHLRTIKFH